MTETKTPRNKSDETACETSPFAFDVPGGPLSPAALGPAVADVLSHAATAPGYAAEVAKAAARQSLYALEAGGRPQADKEDHRFADPAWGVAPFNFFASNFLLIEDWLNSAILSTPGVSPRHARLAAFAARQWLDAFSPSNLPWTNPEVLRATFKEGGLNFVRGYQHWLEDLRHEFDPKTAAAAEEFVVGRDVAATPGKVVLRNELIELIQYAPQTPQTRPEPLLIVPAWIMKYYILDLSPHNSLIRYLVGRGFTVFCISWRNPGPEMAETSFDDYRRLGVMAALDAVSAIGGAEKIHALGYCLGGTLLSVAAAAMARDGDDRLATLCLLAAQTDFTKAGELQIFVDETQLDQLDRIMARQGYLDASQMAGAFSMLRARDLIWSRMVKSYLLGEKAHTNDLMAWNADATRMPCRMHSTYLRALFLHNDLAEGRFEAGGKPVRLDDIHAPVFAVGTEGDHVAPWRSVYKIRRFVSGDVVFLLAAGGHNGGIVSEPGHRKRSYRLLDLGPRRSAPAPRDYLARASVHPGSWWPTFADWLDAHSGAFGPPPPMGAALCDAPGTYVHQR
ncbi:alpha/beta fold hydrolase [Rhodoblastus acidophilus]|uniref:Alpha/beta fold hydrolase n=1 Tax=Candidatus Rhodoblastus alkanivorans TaxID=2954117 RepID=A0ABS9Z440_9HYPH|nr:alpha/beta fold hydrolase [Candidatus Rhodoblastus alkanivorans]MCI4680454.1 alpha/beta fold hydrolase [Candidatus Rhodoblastus alkanivorans]MCI4681947.1 alpha/beta fold hydrolase [Candidatus Rhodoblastus alkanivorans]MDI4642997.1 alpha/beta fold hydrolase [Rhodoblastus acidophilus]